MAPGKGVGGMCVYVWLSFFINFFSSCQSSTLSSYPLFSVATILLIHSIICNYTKATYWHHQDLTMQIQAPLLSLQSVRGLSNWRSIGCTGPSQQTACTNAKQCGNRTLMYQHMMRPVPFIPRWEFHTRPEPRTN